jgi:hypothetical protein
MNVSAYADKSVLDKGNLNYALRIESSFPVVLSQLSFTGKVGIVPLPEHLINGYGNGV